MEITLKYRLPNDAYSYKLAQMGPSAVGALWDISGRYNSNAGQTLSFRSLLKYDCLQTLVDRHTKGLGQTEAQLQVISDVCYGVLFDLEASFYQILKDNDVNLDIGEL